MYAQHFVPIHLVDVKIFYWVSENFDLLVALEEKVFTIHPPDTMNVCSKFHDNPSNSCQDILLKNKNVNLMVAPKETSDDHQNHQDSSSECYPMTVCTVCTKLQGSPLNSC